MSRAIWSLVGLASVSVCLPGCVQRRIRITSTPPGALVHLNDVQIGRTPVDAAFKFYGVYDVRLELKDHEPLQVGREAGAPIWEWPGLDLAATVAPFDFENVVEWHFDLEPSLERRMSEDEAVAEVLDRARELKAELLASEPSR